MFDKLIRYCIYFLIFFIPLENVFLSNISFAPAYILISQLSDIIVVIAISVIILEKGVSRKKLYLVGGGYDLLLLIFLLAVYFSAIIHTANVIEVSLNLKVLLRYLFVVYIILNLNLQKDFFDKVVKYFFLTILIQQFIAFLQLFIGLPAYELFMGSADWIEVGGRKIYNTNFNDARKGWLIGTQARSIQFALITLLGFVFHQVFYSQNKNLRYWIVTGLYVFFLIMSGSRSVFLVALLSLLFMNILKNGIARWLKYSIILSPLVFIMLIVSFLYLPENYILHIFTKEYIKEASNQRLGVLLIMIPAFFKANFIDIILGFTPDKEIVFDYFLQFPNRPSLIRNQAETIEDVYWVAFAYYYGLLGLSIFVLFVYGIFKKLKYYFERTLSISDKWSLLALVLIIQVVFLSFFNQVLEVKQYSFFFWLFIAIALYQKREIKKI